MGLRGLEEDVIARLGWNPFRMTAELEIEGAVTRLRDGYRADLAFRNREGQPLGKRRLESRGLDCRALGDAVAVAITVAIDPDAAAVRPAPVEEVPPSDAPASPSVPLPSAGQGTVSPARARALVSGGAAAGLVPNVVGVASLRVSAVAYERAEIGLGTAIFSGGAAAGLGFSLVHGELRGCASPWGTRGLARICGAFLAGIFSSWVRAPELGPIDVGGSPWLGVAAGPTFSVPLAERVRLEVVIDAVVPLTRRQAFVRNIEGPVWEQSVIGVRSELGLAALF